MPRAKKSPCKGRSGGKTPTDLGNVTIYDSADVPGSARVPLSVRLRKSEKNSVITEARREFATRPTETLAALDWHERDLDSYDDEIDSIIARANYDAKGLDETQTTTSRQKKGSNRADDSAQSNSYPVDFWFLVAAYIRPEDTGRFAAICHCTHMITHTAHFWRQLYRRIHGLHPILLPVDLQAESIERLHGLRARVIRSLHYAYPDYQTTRLKWNSTGTTFNDNLSTLEGMQCLAGWARKISQKLWHFYFKFRHREYHCPMATRVDEKVVRDDDYELLKGFDDMHDNPNDGCYVLQIACSAYTSVPVSMGLNLVSIGVSVSRCMRFHRVKLVMDARSYIRAQTPESTIIILDPALNAKVHPWWRPSYGMLSLL